MTDGPRTSPRFSVIVASRHRPKWLKRCLSSLRQQNYPHFEIILVADRESLGAIDDPGIKPVAVDVPNLSHARNQGIAQAGGSICAFIDDDAVAEPMWLQHLADAFDATAAVAVTGYVRGRNGISYQSRSTSIDGEAETHIEPHSTDAPAVLALKTGRATKLIGTNMAVRRKTLEEIGGFDEDFRFFLEDADISLRLGKSGEKVAVAPLAQVHHGFAASSRRTALRAPLDLFDVGRSTSLFLRKHIGQASDELWLRILRREHARLVRHLIRGTCEPRDLRRRLAGLKAGWDDGLNLQIEAKPILFEDAAFQNYPDRYTGHAVSSSKWIAQRAKLLRNAQAKVLSGSRASVFSFSLTPFRHHVRYVEPGIWLQTGGVYGRSDRSGRRFRWCSFAKRLDGEIRCVAKIRGMREIANR